MFAIVSVISPGVRANAPEWETDWEDEEDDDHEKKKRRRKIKRRQPGEPIFGDNCHWCKRETLQIPHVKCSRCPLRFCGGCLRRRHGEDVEEEMEENVRWVCPICRGGCGPGCRINCCNCSSCRKYQQLEPAGRIVPAALKAGFDNVHDYLVHFETGEPPEVIAKRKEGRGWTKATGALDTSSLDITKEDDLHPLCHWAMKRMRSARRPLVARSNTKWGNHEQSAGGGCRPEDDKKAIVSAIKHTIPAQDRDSVGKRTRRPSIRLDSSVYKGVD